MLISNEKLHDLIENIYEAAVDPEKWPVLVTAVANLLENTNYQDFRGYSQHHQNTFLPGSEAPETISLQSALLQVCPLSSDSEEASGQYSQTELDAILLRHFKSALGIAQKLNVRESYRAIMTSVLDQLPVGLLILNSKGSVLESNFLAKKMLENQGLLKIEDGIINVKDRELKARLFKAIQAVALDFSGKHNQVLMLGEAARPLEKLMVLLSTIYGQQDESGNQLVAAFLSSPKNQPVSIPDSLTQYYGLTKKEVEVACLLIRGFSVKELANEMHVTEHTARSHLKSLLSKTKTQRQTELVRILLTGPRPIIEQAQQVALYRGSIQNQEVKQVTVKDGRTLSYSEYGKPMGKPILYLHSILGGGKELELMATSDEISELGYRIIAPDRPGYGRSSVDKNGSLSAFAEDLNVLLEHLKITQLPVLGFSMGALYGGSFANAYPNRVQKLIAVSAGLASTEKSEFQQMNPLWRVSMLLARDVPKAFRLIANLMYTTFRKNPHKVYSLISSSVVGEEKTRFLDSKFEKEFCNVLNYGWQQGLYSVCREVERLVGKPDFEPGSLPTHVVFWHGNKDMHVPLSVARRLEKQLPSTEFREELNSSHFFICLKLKEILCVEMS
ncbi:alpha/beta fold hydrolase [Grimontia sp. NTOU-MAR1]|uniref:alpha/beta fold hydrolase n=1 Tax=Grimontia sp. NTOU-MAR1 TaxID=3111011 RepID=UPI002DBA885D|nr:alpha/beta fold hydrolase [Grimontia sp. NTOU-MAR1]WRV96273.1 alpha/beta fold hydrolase [Grimontia sp. NTOU-MAR1]